MIPRVVLIASVAALIVAGAIVLTLRSSRSQIAAPPTVTSTQSDQARETAARPPLAAEPATPKAAPPRPAPRSSAVPKAPPPGGEAGAAPIATGTLVITSDVRGAQVFLDRQFIGLTPVTAEDVKPGSHSLNVSAPGYDAYVETVDVTPGPREIAIKFREVRLDLAIDVVHKHRIGSCKGRLIATAQGLRYDTADRDDVFGTTLLELEAFQVDYLTKNLRVQLRKGKRYDFTDPDGNADRLFVFHRDVERARERLRKGDVPGGW